MNHALLSGLTPGILFLLSCAASSSAVPDSGPADVGPEDVVSDPGTFPATWYHLEAVFEDGTKLELNRDLSDKNPSTIFSFGSTHIAPAVSLALTDTVYDPYVIVTINPGVVEGTEEHPIQCKGPGDYPFGTGFPPAFDLYAHNLQFRSTVEGAEGVFRVTKWTTMTGDTFEGEVEGRLVFDSPKANPPSVQVACRFRLTLPEPAEGQ